MFDNIQTIIAGFSGKLKESPTLRKWFWVFVAAQLFTLIVLWYNAFMSLNFYQKMLERFADMQGEFLPYVVTISIALIAYFLISSITATVLDYIAGRKYKTEGHEPMFIAAILGLLALLSLDIYANLQGVDFVAYDTTTEVMANPLDNLGAEFSARRENAESAYQPRIQKLESQIAAIKDSRLASQTGHNRNCKTLCPYKKGTGAVHWNGAVTPYGHSLIADYAAQISQLEGEYNAELAAIRSEQATKTEAAKDDYSRDKSRFDVSVSDKQSGHRKLVYFAYALAILLSFVSNHYADRAAFAIAPDREAELIAAFETQQDRIDAMKAAQRAKYQYGNEGTQQVLQQILAQMEQGPGLRQMPGPDVHPKEGDKDKIGFRQVEPATLAPERLGESSQVLPQIERVPDERLHKLWEKIDQRLEQLEKREEAATENPSYISDPKPQVIYHHGKMVDDKKHPNFTSEIQPDRGREFDRKKYQRFLNVSKQVLKEKGRYDRTAIAAKAGISRRSASKYYRMALEKKDLEF